MSSEVPVRTDLFPRRLADVSLLEFFGAPPAAGYAAAASATVLGGGNGQGLSSTVEALRLLAAEQVQGSAAAAGGSTRQQQQQQQQEEHAPSMPLFQLLAGAAGDSSPADPSGRSAQAEVVAAEWAAAVVFSRYLLQS
jgi:hypothetical protein